MDVNYEMDNDDGAKDVQCYYDERRVLVSEPESSSFQEETSSVMKMIKQSQEKRYHHSKVEISSSSISQRLGYLSKRKQESRSEDGISTHLDWSMKLKRPRMGMVADLEEEKRGVKTRVQSLVKDVNKNFASIKSYHSSFDEDDDVIEDDCKMVFRVINDDAAEESESPLSTSFESDFDEDEGYKEFDKTP